ncbi:MAG: phosphoribosylanthranilate isomerase [Lachnospiraceae bacterium]|nr:phosphoribosylanthranilate isomerase [Lachnospiraceae bacterium]
MIACKLCGLSRLPDIEAANRIRPEYVGFVFWPKSSRAVTKEQAALLRKALDPEIRAVGVFVDEAPETVARLLREGIIDLAQLHGSEDEACLDALRELTDKPLIRAFRIRSKEDVQKAVRSSADEILLDAGAGDGRLLDRELLKGIERPYFLAGGLDPENVREAAEALRPRGVDVSSGIETEGRKDPVKMEAFVRAVRSIY